MNSDPMLDQIVRKGIQALELAEFEDAIELFEQTAVADSSAPTQKALELEPDYNFFEIGGLASREL